MSEKVEFEVEIDTDLLEEVERITAPMGLIAQRIFEEAIEFISNPANEIAVIEMLVR